MKCENKIVFHANRERRTQVAVYSWFHLKQGQIPTPGHADIWETCGGLVTVSIGIETSDGCGCCGGSSVGVSYRCTRCKGEFYPELPQSSEELADVMTAFLEKMSGKDHTALKDVRWGAEEALRQRYADTLAKKAKKV